MKSVGEVMAIGRTSRNRCRRRCAGWKPARMAWIRSGLDLDSEEDKVNAAPRAA
jgi:carbamoylphosphate synthase large subunit